MISENKYHKQIPGINNNNNTVISHIILPIIRTVLDIIYIYYCGVIAITYMHCITMQAFIRCLLIGTVGNLCYNIAILVILRK